MPPGAETPTPLAIPKDAVDAAARAYRGVAYVPVAVSNALAAAAPAIVAAELRRLADEDIAKVREWTERERSTVQGSQAARDIAERISRHERIAARLWRRANELVPQQPDAALRARADQLDSAGDLTDER